jgi:phospholipid transport system substrate-binding protein
LTQVKDETVGFFPQRHRIAGGQAEVRTEVHGAGNPIPVNYRLLQSATGWKIVDVGVMGVWLAENYEGSFEHQIDVSGIDGLIATLAAKNKASGG